MADVKWIKIYTDMVSNKKIKRIRKLPEGNNIVLIWVFLLAQAGECNKNGALYLTDTISFRPEDLAIEFDFEVSIINLALITLERFSMIEVFDEIIYIKNWNEYQNIDGMDKIREQTRLRNIKYRENQKLLLLSDATVTSRDATELELELELDKEKNTTDDFDKVRIAYREIHQVLDMPMQDSIPLSKMLKDGVPPDLIITTMKDKFKLGVKTIKYYVEAINERYKQSKPKQMPMDPQIAARHREIAFNRWIDKGGKPDEFIYNAPTGT